MRTSVLLLAVATVLLPAARANLQLHALFTDHAVLQRDTTVPVWGWGDEGESVTVEIHGHRATGSVKNGRWKVELPPLPAGGPYELKVASRDETLVRRNVLVGEVWLCSGQSNMAWKLAQADGGPEAANAAAVMPLRLFRVEINPTDAPQENLRSGGWQVATAQTAGDFSAVAFYFGRALAKRLGVPIGLIQSAVGGTPGKSWVGWDVIKSDPKLAAIAEEYAAALAVHDQELQRHEDAKAAWQRQVEQAKADGKEPPEAPHRARVVPMGPRSPKRPAALYYGMIKPLQPYAIRGVAWYQGETDSLTLDDALRYQTLLPALIQSWRRDWGRGDFPFLLVQLARFQGVREPEWMVVRDAQLHAARTVPRTAMAVIADLPAETIHPTDKEPVGERLALAARALAYGDKDVVYSGPLYNPAQTRVSGGGVEIGFDHVGGGLVAAGGALRGFTVAGADGKFVPARAEIRGERVLVRSEAVPMPVAVRYAWAIGPDMTLFNRAGLPASPFRTDSFKLTSRTAAPGGE